jgi:hypothetical protein
MEGVQVDARESGSHARQEAHAAASGDAERARRAARRVTLTTLKQQATACSTAIHTHMSHVTRHTSHITRRCPYVQNCAAWASSPGTRKEETARPEVVSTTRQCKGERSRAYMKRVLQK